MRRLAGGPWAGCWRRRRASGGHRTPEVIAQVGESHTGVFLRDILGSAGGGATPECGAAGPFSNRGRNNPSNAITISGAREHNLKNLSIDIPREKIVVVTGLSGSGKSTLAFDILFAEGQRRFLDSMSAYARQFVDQLRKTRRGFYRGAASQRRHRATRDPRRRKIDRGHRHGGLSFPAPPGSPSWVSNIARTVAFRSGGKPSRPLPPWFSEWPRAARSRFLRLW